MKPSLDQELLRKILAARIGITVQVPFRLSTVVECEAAVGCEETDEAMIAHVYRYEDDFGVLHICVSSVNSQVAGVWIKDEISRASKAALAKQILKAVLEQQAIDSTSDEPDDADQRDGESYEDWQARISGVPRSGEF